MKKEINNICYECGASANVLTCLKKYGRRPNKLAHDVSSPQKDKCDLCEEKRYLMDPADFFYPDFDLLINATLK